MTKEVILDFSPERGRIVVYVSDGPDVKDRCIPLDITHFTPMNRFPILAKDPTGELPQAIVDELIREVLEDDELWWHDYYKTRRDTKATKGAELALADAAYRSEALDRLEEKGRVFIN